MIKIKRKTTWGNHYSKDRKNEGVVRKPTTTIKLFLFGLIPIKTLHRYRKEYSGIVVNIDKDGNPVYTFKTREKFLKSKIKHAKTRDFVIGNLQAIVRNTDDEKIESIAKSTIKQLETSKEYSVDINYY